MVLAPTTGIGCHKRKGKKWSRKTVHIFLVMIITM